jgi:hypothetical protein
MNNRINEKLEDKHNEALKMLPVLFSENNFDATICDPPYAGYSEIPDISIFDDYPKIGAYNTIGTYPNDITSMKLLNRNLFIYSLAKVSPSIFHGFIYNSGNYLNASIALSPSWDNSIDFIQNYDVLSNLSKVTDFSNEKGMFLFLQNKITHSQTLLQEPNYEPTLRVDNSNYSLNDQFKTSITGEKIEINGLSQLRHYHINMAAFIQLGKWFDYLKVNDVYDNTRIIIVSDHGFDLGLKPELMMYDDDMLFYNALLMVKDFNESNFGIDYSFMTNADVPYLATNEIIDRPVNLFNGNEITETKKKDRVFKVFGSHQFDVETNNGNQFNQDVWYSIHDDCLNPDNWKLIQ